VRALRAAALVVLASALAYSVRAQWHTVGHDVQRLPWLDGVAALLLSVIGVGAAMLAWRAMLADLGSPLPPLAAAHVYSVSQVGKYLPGSVWPVLTQMELGRGFAVPRLRMATAFFLTLLSSLAVALSAGGLVSTTIPGWGRAYALLPLCLVVLHPTLLLPLSRLASTLLRRPAVTAAPTLPGVARMVGWMALQWTCLGMVTLLLAHGLGTHVNLLLAVGATALSWAVGLVVIVVPAGAGVREGTLVLLLAPTTGTAHALSIALLGRLGLTLADAAFALFGLLVTRLARRRHSADEATASR